MYIYIYTYIYIYNSNIGVGCFGGGSGGWSGDWWSGGLLGVLNALLVADGVPKRPSDLPRLDLENSLPRHCPPKASVLDHFSDPIRAKIGPRQVLKRYFVQDVDFHNISRLPF